MVDRIIKDLLLSRFERGKVILLIGPRQVGKSTLMKELQKSSGLQSIYLNCDEPDIRNMLLHISSTEFKTNIGKNKLIFIDEAQQVEDIGLTLKLIVDSVPDIQLVVSGSSAFELRNETNEPLTGRKFEFHIYPISIPELVAHHGYIEEKRMLERRLIYGLYPEIINNPGEEQELLTEIVNSYLYKDILSFQDIRKPDLLDKMLTALALQVGQEVSYNELSQLLQVDKTTIERYISLLEKCFVVFRLSSFSRNLRNELKKSKKIYFYDNGVRNAILRNYSPLALRQDVGALWENFIIAERIKQIAYNRDYRKQYFWRTQTQQEIDLLEEKDGTLYAFEFKWTERKKVKLPKSFADNYPNHEFEIISPANYIEFLNK